MIGDRRNGFSGNDGVVQELENEFQSFKLSLRKMNRTGRALWVKCGSMPLCSLHEIVSAINKIRIEREKKKLTSTIIYIYDNNFNIN